MRGRTTGDLAHYGRDLNGARALRALPYVMRGGKVHIRVWAPSVAKRLGLR